MVSANDDRGRGGRGLRDQPSSSQRPSAHDGSSKTLGLAPRGPATRGALCAGTIGAGPTSTVGNATLGAPQAPASYLGNEVAAGGAAYGPLASGPLVSAPLANVNANAASEHGISAIRVTDDLGEHLEIRRGEFVLLGPLIDSVIENLQTKLANER